MAGQTDRLEHARIASPCPANWEQMSGDDRVRFCELCNLHVYNIARLTRKEAESLIANTEGRLCARLFRRSDGTIITKDCPIGLRAIRRRVAKVAGAVFATIMSLAASVAGQKPNSKDKSSCQQQVMITKPAPDAKQEAGSISGTVLDPNGAAIPGVKIRVARKTGEAVTTSATDDKGSFRVRGLKSDVYELSLESKGFTSLKIVEIKLAGENSVTVAAILLPKNVEVVIGIVGTPWLIDTPPGTTIFSSDLIQRLPH